MSNDVLVSSQTGSVYLVVYRNPETGDSVSYRSLGGDTYRVRVQITDPARVPADGIPVWGSAKGNDHLSRTATGVRELAAACAQGAVILATAAEAEADEPEPEEVAAPAAPAFNPDFKI